MCVAYAISMCVASIARLDHSQRCVCGFVGVWAWCVFFPVYNIDGWLCVCVCVRERERERGRERERERERVVI
jgi:hypothetical protein